MNPFPEGKERSITNLYQSGTGQSVFRNAGGKMHYAYIAVALMKLSFKKTYPKNKPVYIAVALVDLFS